MDKKSARIRRATRARRKLQELGATRLVVHRTPRHIYAQVIAPNGSEVLVAASTVTKTNATVTIANYSQSCEGENTTTFNGFRYAVYRDQLFLQFASLFFDVSHLTPLP